MSFAGAHSWMSRTLFTKITQEKRKIEQIFSWNHMPTRFVMSTLIYVISMEFLSLSHKCSSSQNIPSGEEQGVQGETAVFCRLVRLQDAEVTKTWESKLTVLCTTIIKLVSLNIIFFPEKIK